MTKEEMLAVSKPILFNTEMVRAVKDNRKTVTRRVVKPQPAGDGSKPEELLTRPGYWNTWGDDNVYRMPYRPGDILYVRETWRRQPLKWSCEGGYSDFVLQYRADFTDEENGCYGRRGGIAPQKWHPSIHMPKEAARLFLRVTDVRVERLQEITEDDVVAEGAEPLISCPNEHGVIEPDGTLGDMCWNTDCCGNCMYIEKTYGELFGEIVWNNTIKLADLALYGWDSNPWVWVIEFEKMEAENA